MVNFRGNVGELVGPGIMNRYLGVEWSGIVRKKMLGKDLARG
jgi:hypothetical protein